MDMARNEQCRGRGNRSSEGRKVDLNTKHRLFSLNIVLVALRVVNEAIHSGLVAHLLCFDFGKRKAMNIKLSYS